MIDANLLAIPDRIKGQLGGRINRHNLLMLSGAGNAISSALEYAIDRLLQDEAKKSLVDLNLSIEIAVYPRDALQDSGARLIRTDVLAQLESEADKTLKRRLILNDPNIFQLAPDGCPVVLSAWPIPGGMPTVNIATWLPRGDAGPCVELVCIPMSYVVDQQASMHKHFAVYCHTITPPWSDADSALGGMNYIGITRQGWRRRFEQHLSNARQGSPLLFHRALRDHYRLARVCSHRILNVTDNEKSAMNSEELCVRGTDDPDILGRFSGIETFARGTLYPKGLNMIPGGYEGLRVLHKLGALDRDRPVNIDQREESLIKVMRRGEREGRANPLIAALWFDDDYATKIICGPSGRLKPEQIAQARYMNALGRGVSEIARLVGATTDSQIKRLLEGKTYSRIKKPH